MCIALNSDDLNKQLFICTNISLMHDINLNDNSNEI